MRLQTAAAALLMVLAALALVWPLHAQINLINLSSSITGTLPIGNGGTGQTTQTAAFNALDPLTTQGDLLYHDGTDSVRLAKGTGLKLLRMNSGATAPEWASGVIPIMTTWAGGKTAGYAVPDGQTFYLFFNPVGIFGTVDPATVAPSAVGVSTPTTIAPWTITRVEFSITNAVTTTSAETGSLFIRVNNTTDTTIFNNTLQWSGTPTNVNNYSATGLSLALATGDYWTVKITAPTFATNPTNTWYGVTVYGTAP